jgi:DNA-3-methyladenine glycosylase II
VLPAPLTESSFRDAVEVLARRDPDLRRALDVAGAPAFWSREPGFPTLVLLILEQQVSLASARAANDRLLAMVGDLTPSALLELDDRAMRAVGFSRQKARYVRLLAEAIREGDLDLRAVGELPDEEVRSALLAVTGIGPWTAEAYLLSALRRPDAWPVGDRALAVAAAEVKRLEVVPGPVELLALGEPWRPWRAVAARILWHHYLTRRRRTESAALL